MGVGVVTPAHGRNWPCDDPCPLEGSSPHWTEQPALQTGSSLTGHSLGLQLWKSREWTKIRASALGKVEFRSRRKEKQERKSRPLRGGLSGRQ